MTKLALPLSLAALAVLGACTTTDPVAPAPAPVVMTPAPAVVAAPAPAGTVYVQPQVAAAPMVVPQPTAIRAGNGRIESINPLPTSAATGSGSVKPMKRLGIKMDDGTVQYVDTAAENVSIGQRIELTRDGHIRH